MLEAVRFVACLASRPEIAAWHLKDAWDALGSERTWPLVGTFLVNTNDGGRATVVLTKHKVELQTAAILVKTVANI